jgi:hypothetical protein
MSKAFINAYIECALWASSDDNDTPLDKNYGIADISSEALETMKADCNAFMDTPAYREYGDDAERAGYDFWLTRNGHGAGFWDGDWDDFAGSALTAASKAFGECSLYVGDDGLLYCGG